MVECNNATEKDGSKINFHLKFEGRTSSAIMVKTKQNKEDTN
jgi:hypothetical protein